jgi:hypothetical protein
LNQGEYIFTYKNHLLFNILSISILTMKTTLILSLLAALAVATPVQVLDELPYTGLYNRSPQSGGKGKGSGAKAKGGDGGASTESAGKGGNTAMKNGWEPMTKVPAGKSAEPCLAPEDCDYSHLSMNELANGACKPITFIFARATTELGNMVGHISQIPTRSNSLTQVIGGRSRYGSI